MKFEFVPVDYSSQEINGREYVQIVGRDKSGKKVCLFHEYHPFFWLIVNEKKANSIKSQIEKLIIQDMGKEIKTEKIEVLEKNFLEKKVKALKIYAKNYSFMQELSRKVQIMKVGKVYGNDLGIITQYICETKFSPSNFYEISGEAINENPEFSGIEKEFEVSLCVKIDSIKECKEEKFVPKFMAYDIETDEIQIGEGEILMISLVDSKGDKKVITWKNQKGNREHSFVEYVVDEKELLKKFAEEVNKFSPDFLVGYFSDRFDFPYIKARAEKLKVKLHLGIDESPMKFSRGQNPSGKINGIVHVDLAKFINTAYSQYMQSETLSLNEIAKEFLGEEKLKIEFKHSSKIVDEEWNHYFEYNLQDSVLTLKLFEKFWPDLLEFSRIIKEPIFEISRNGMSKNVESYIIHHLEKYNEIPERKPEHHELTIRMEREKYEGAFVFEPTAGLYEDIAMFDFTSYWPSIIVTFNLSKSTLLDKKEKESTEIEIKERKVYFSKKIGFFPDMLKELIEKRKEYKKELNKNPDVIKKARSNAFKLLANASYGYLGFFGARYYCPEASASATAISRKFIKETIDIINKEGYKVIYSDTDSIAFLKNKRTNEEVKELLEKINKKLPGIMELELEDFYERGIWVTKRTGEIGAKKKYALINGKNKMKIRGFETVRRDWCKLARVTQNNVLRLILEDGNEKRALTYVQEIIKKLKERKIDKKDLMIRTQLKKPISEYKSISPHVVAAKKMKELNIPVSNGSLVEYYLAETAEKTKLVRDKVKLPEEKGEYNMDYYLNQQLLPAVENIFHVFKIEMKEKIDGKRQTKLDF
ncbi:ribonuclease H-like domain-containing protein [Candidatus Pacearchaeota archaeon]|nr:ribonuclease H-like domain-containing protein [Candidatus Pacearchaeota archaeon]